jgi:hypothetical protein
VADHYLRFCNTTLCCRVLQPAIRRTRGEDRDNAVNEWQFTSEVAKWIVLILQRNKGLPFGDAYCEGQAPDSPKRRDLTVKDRIGRIVLTGEVKLPGKKDGATPYNAKVVEDARTKARRAGVRYFFTWNVN